MYRHLHIAYATHLQGDVSPELCIRIHDTGWLTYSYEASPHLGSLCEAQTCISVIEHSMIDTHENISQNPVIHPKPK